MRPSIILAAGLLAGAVSMTPVAAQTVSPLSYVQPLPQQAVQSVQDHLRQSGAYSGRVDGIWGTDSQAALERFQGSHQLQVTGQINEATAKTLGLDPNALLISWTAAPGPPPTALRQSSVRAIQSGLRGLGFYGGAVDGVWGPATEDGVRRYQQANSLLPNGQPNPATVSAMGLMPDELAYR